TRRRRWRPVLRRKGREHGRGRRGLRWTGPLLLSTAPAGLPRPAAHRALAAHQVSDPLHERRPRPLREHRPAAREGEDHSGSRARGLQGTGAWAARDPRPGARRRRRFPPQEGAMTASQHMVQANGLRFRVMADGPSTGELLVMLHGFPEGAESWSRAMDAVAKAGGLAAAPDMRGYGLTDAPTDVGDYAMPQLVEDVNQLVKS